MSDHPRVTAGCLRHLVCLALMLLALIQIGCLTAEQRWERLNQHFATDLADTYPPGSTRAEVRAKNGRPAQQGEVSFLTESAGFYAWCVRDCASKGKGTPETYDAFTVTREDHGEVLCGRHMYFEFVLYDQGGVVIGSYLLFMS
ncbi:MAG: hypothetical protein V2A76_09885 [Planctomycetota bacterium]